MKGIVLYYSASGNNRMMAKAIHRGLKKVIDADVASIKEVNPRDVAKYDLIGIGSPIWFFREPANVRLFLNRLPAQKLKGKYAFLYSCHGATPFWLFASMTQILQRKGMIIIGWRSWFGGGGSGAEGIVAHAMVIPGYEHIRGHPDEIDLKEAEEFGREIAERALQISAGRADLIPEIPKGEDVPMQWRPHPIGEPFPGIRVSRKINWAKCNYPSCTLCQDLCPAGCIDLSLDQPFKAGCWNESLCNRICPTNAIELEPKEIAIHLRPQYVIDMSKCSYPKCKLCVENCPMDSIDFSTQPPTFKHSCEGCDLCWAICPKGAIDIANLEQTHKPLFERARSMGRDGEWFRILRDAEAKGLFRRYIPEEMVLTKGIPMYEYKKIPRYVIPEDP